MADVVTAMSAVSVVTRPSAVSVKAAAMNVASAPWQRVKPARNAADAVVVAPVKTNARMPHRWKVAKDVKASAMAAAGAVASARPVKPTRKA